MYIYIYICIEYIYIYILYVCIHIYIYTHIIYRFVVLLHICIEPPHVVNSFRYSRSRVSPAVVGKRSELNEVNG